MLPLFDLLGATYICLQVLSYPYIDRLLDTVLIDCPTCPYILSFLEAVIGCWCVAYVFIPLCLRPSVMLRSLLALCGDGTIILFGELPAQGAAFDPLCVHSRVAAYKCT